MSTATARRDLAAIQAELYRLGTEAPLVRTVRTDPARIMMATGLNPDPWQVSLLRSSSPQMALLCSRQAGKSTVAAALALAEALTRPNALVLLLSPSERQSGELAIKTFGYYDALDRPVPTRKRTELQLHLVNGSRIIALPENERTIRGYSGARLLVVDEASRVSDGLYHAVRPMLAVSRGRLLALTTPYGKRGWFFEAWSGAEEWNRVTVTARQCPRIPAEFLASEERSMGPRWYRQEYECSFEDTEDSVFTSDQIAAAARDDITPLFAV